MPKFVNCPSCHQALRVPDDLLGQDVKCPSCQTQFHSTPDTASGSDTGFRSLEERASEPVSATSEVPRDQPPASTVTRVPLPKLDDLDDDEGDEAHIRYRQGVSRSRAMERVAGPANGLLATGIIGLALSGLGLAGSIASNALGAQGGADLAADMAANIVGMGAAIAVSILIIVGAQKMRRLEGYGLAKAAAILAIIPCISPCCIIGIPFGIQALNALGEEEVRRAFE